MPSPWRGIESLHPEARFRVVSRMLARLEPRFIALGSTCSSWRNLSFPQAEQHGHSPLRHKGEEGVRRSRYSPRGRPRSRGLETFEIKPGMNVIPSLGISLEVSFSGYRPGMLFRKERDRLFFDGERVSSLTLRTFREGDRFTPLGMDRR